MADQDDDTLSQAIARHGIVLPADQVALLDQYAALLWDWNQKLNLTRHTTYEKFVARDLVDSLEFSKLLAAGEDVLDVGTGGGVPGVILAITRPDVSISLVDSVGKKSRVVQQIVEELGLGIPVHHARVQDLLADASHDTLVVRAVAPLPKLLSWLDPHWGSFRRLLVLKGPSWVEERRAARELGLMRSLQLRKAASYRMSGTESESVVLEIGPKGD